MKRELLIVTTNKHVCALDPADGREVWRTKLPKVRAGVIAVLLRGDDIFVGAYGRVLCLDRANGQILWQNELPGTGFHHVILAMESAAPDHSTAALVAAVEQIQQAQAAASRSGASTS